MYTASRAKHIILALMYSNVELHLRLGITQREIIAYISHTIEVAYTVLHMLLCVSLCVGKSQHPLSSDITYSRDRHNISNLMLASVRVYKNFLLQNFLEFFLEHSLAFSASWGVCTFFCGGWGRFAYAPSQTTTF